jgi:uncharacterized protein
LTTILFTVKMMMMYARRLKLPQRTFFLLGPRGTGKTTWLRRQLPRARWFNLLLDRELVSLATNPGHFRREIEALPKGSWVVVDEVQRLPALLNDVHDVLSTSTRRVRFALTGSSARKLRRGDVNLLAGRALSRLFFPLTFSETGAGWSPDARLRFGALPGVVTERTAALKQDLLEAYRDTYLTQEIRNEALAKDLGSFSRFLSVAALANGQVTNIASIARDAGVTRPTVQGYFDVLQDTLIGSWLPALRPRAKVKEVAHPKFFFFDCGVVRSLQGRQREALQSEERGHLLETYLFHELRSYQHDAQTGGELSYWRTPSGTEVDFVWRTPSATVAVEVKASESWRSAFGRPLQEIAAALKPRRQIVVYLGDKRLKDHDIEVLPLDTFLMELNRGDVLG